MSVLMYRNLLSYLVLFLNTVYQRAFVVYKITLQNIFKGINILNGVER